MPVPAQVGCSARNNHNMADSGFDPRITAGADVCLASLIGLDGVHGWIVEHHPKNPHATTASVSTTNTTTSTMSVVDRF